MKFSIRSVLVLVAAVLFAAVFCGLSTAGPPAPLPGGIAAHLVAPRLVAPANSARGVIFALVAPDSLSPAAGVEQLAAVDRTFSLRHFHGLGCRHCGHDTTALSDRGGRWYVRKGGAAIPRWV